MRLHRWLWILPLVLMAVEAAADVEPSATRLVINGQSRIYRTYGRADGPEVFAPIARELQRFGLVSEWQPGQAQVTLGCAGALYRWRVARDRYDIEVDRSRARDLSRAEALEMGGELFLPVRATVAAMGGTVMWEDARRSLHVQLGVLGRPGMEREPLPESKIEIRTPTDARAPLLGGTASGSGPAVTRLEWSEADSGLALNVEATAPVRARILRLTNPNRLVIDFRPARFALESSLEPRGVVRSVRTGQFEANVARLVLDLGSTHLAGTGIPATPQSRFTIRLAASSAPPKPVAVVPRSSAAKSSAFKRPRRLASRGGYPIRDLERLKELAAAGEAILQGKIICIDAGHGGHSGGAPGAGFQEKELTLQMALEAARALREAGATVILTRADDTFVSLPGRVDLANDRGVDLFISIHCNSMPQRNTMSGTETYYCTAQSLDLARSIHPQIVGVMGGRDGGIRRRGFFVIRNTQMPSVLLEVGYINHTDDEAKLSDSTYQRSIGEAIRDGVIQYFATG